MDEYDAAFAAYRAAQARINNAASWVTLGLWGERVAALRPSLPGAFLSDTARLVAGGRRMSRRLAQAWYQYARALDTGYQLGELEDGVEGGTLDRLRQNFLDRLQEAALLGEEESGDDNADRQYLERELSERNYASGGDRLRRRAVGRRELDRHIQDFLDRWGEDLELDHEDFRWRTDSDLESIRRWAERKLREVAREESQDRRKRLRDRERQARSEDSEYETSDEELESEHEKAGQKVAGEVHASVADQARQVKEWAHNNDVRVKAVARGTSATPCAFCAMLASRGFSYTSVQSAMTTRNSVAREMRHNYVWSSGFRKVHPNCNCYPIIRWKTIPMGQQTPLNDEFKKLWKDSGSNLNSFRRAMYRRNKTIIEQAKSQEE